MLEKSYGACIYCGQVSDLDFDEALSQDERNKQVTRSCHCSRAALARKQEERIEAAKERIDMMFGEDAEDFGFLPVEDEQIIKMLNDVAEQVARRKVQSVGIQLAGGTRAKICVTSKGDIKIERSETNKKQLEG